MFADCLSLVTPLYVITDVYEGTYYYAKLYDDSVY